MKQDGERDELVRTLDEIGRLEAQERRDADALEDAPGLANVERVLEDVWAAERKRPARRWPLFVGMIAVAAAVVALLVPVLQSPPKVGEPFGEVLGNDTVHLDPQPKSPSGQWPPAVTWKGPQGLEYRLRIVEYTGGIEGRELFTPPAIFGYKQALPEDSRAWPDTIKLSLSAKNKEGDEQGPDEDVWERSR